MNNKEKRTKSDKEENHPSNLILFPGEGLRRLFGDITGILLIGTGILIILVLLVPSVTGKPLVAFVLSIRKWVGLGILWIVFFTLTGGFRLISKRDSISVDQRVFWKTIILELTAISSLGFLSALMGSTLERAEKGLDGGRIGWGIFELFRMIFRPIGIKTNILPTILLGIVFLIGLIIGFDLLRLVPNLLRKITRPADGLFPSNDTGEQSVSTSPITGLKTSQKPSTRTRKPTHLPKEFQKQLQFESPEFTKAYKRVHRDDRLPGLDMLIDERIMKPDERNINLTAGLIEKTLFEFGVPAKVIGFKVGPTVTQFAVEPGFINRADQSGKISKQRIRVSQISTLSRDLALALSAERLRIQAPVPGRPYLGIEVPNRQSSVVRLRNILETEEYSKVNSPLAIALGLDVSGNPVIADLASMPHLLVAGTTGSGKSVCVAALTTCLVMNNSPEDLRIIMIDPKMVELVRFNGLAHLYGKVETKMERIMGVLRWIVLEMERRYKILEKSRSRHIDSYNRKVIKKKNAEVLPKIVVMIDELSDLMMAAPDQTEGNLVRLAQMARATGIHLVVATQRPSTDVVTGLIKANFPARISFAVASSVDSRVILDYSGAENLLGKGDMLFLPPEAPAPIRSQGVMVSDTEVEKIITFWQKEYKMVKDQPAPWEALLEQEASFADSDRLVTKAIALIKDTQKASTSMLQRKLRIGFPRAARLMDELEDRGIVGPALGGGREREVFIAPDDEDY